MADKIFGTDFTDTTNPIGTETISINDGIQLKDATLRAVVYQTIANAPEEFSVHDDDNLALLDSQNSNAPRRVEFSTIATWIGTKLGAIINALTGKTTPVAADEFVIADSAASSASKKVTLANLKTVLKYSDVLGGNAAAAGTLGSGASGALALFAGFIASGANAPIPKGGTLKNLRVRTSTAQPASGSLVFTVMVNNVATALTCTLAAGAGAGVTSSDTTNSVVVSAGDLVYILVQNNATSTSASVGIFTIELEQAIS